MGLLDRKPTANLPSNAVDLFLETLSKNIYNTSQEVYLRYIDGVEAVITKEKATYTLTISA